ncbi:MAG: hypothetical protein IIX47_00810 [Spirochaetaceae bacterium]|nr:hypothetical protein [Spirochaetaceae bacterium]
MKKIILSLMIGFVLLACASGTESSEKKLTEKYELTTFNFGNLEFQLPKEFQITIRNSTKKPSGSYIEKVTVDEYLKLPIYMINEKVSNMVSQGKIVTSDDLKKLLSQGEPDILLSYFGLTDIWESYKKININESKIIGETYFSTGDVPSYFGYSIGYLYKGVIYRIYLFTNLPEKMKGIYPEIFMEDNGYLFWKHNPNGKNGRVQAWELILSREKNLPEELILLQDTYEIFLETVKFK